VVEFDFGALVLLMQLKSFKKILIANRGEIALRIMHTCRAMGIASVAVYSDADQDAPHVRFADQAVHIGSPPAVESYLNISHIIEAAVTTGSEAVHPGYGFLSENGDFADACHAAGIAFIGPPSDVIRKMGLKSVARRLVSDAGVPVAPGYDGDAQSEEGLRNHALSIGLPLLIKASAGGGGKGMRVVSDFDEFDAAITSARREAERAFGDGRLLLERYIAGARHVEFQVMGDAHGNLVHLLERDCSIQRRHQKIIEESPSPALNSKIRQSMAQAAVTVARAIGYINAGTVEFILAPSGEFYFIEVNTRLQVEHPVTEMITGLDLVKLQIEIAEGKPLAIHQADIKSSGHAIEARLYAENPANDFLPSTGVVVDWAAPSGIEGLRIDAGIETGSQIPIFYDPMLAKLIAWAPDRDSAIRKLAYSLQSLAIHGVDTNREFLTKILEHPDFASGAYDTGFVAQNRQHLVVTPPSPETFAAIVALYLLKTWQSERDILTNIPAGYRNNPYRDPSVRFRIGGAEIDLCYQRLDDDEYSVYSGDWRAEARILHFEPHTIRIEFDGVQSTYTISVTGPDFFVHSFHGSQLVTRLPRYPDQTSGSNDESAESPMPGQVIKVLVQEGQDVAAGDPLVILEAMKMEQTIRAALDGVVHAILVKAGDVVTPGEALIQIGSKSQSR
jgi:acetyl-CoA carboxylase biotin carboxylase subunit